MNGWEGAVQARGGPQFLEGQIRLLADQRLQVVLLPGNMAGLATGAMVLRTHVADAAALLEELLDHAQGNPKTACHRLAGAFPCVIGRQNPFAQIQREGFHLLSLPRPTPNGYIII
jgi:hypothetical protein